MFRGVRRAGLVSAGAAAILALGATAASAHHCYKADWNDAAATQLNQNSTPWLPLSDLAELVITQDIGLAQCAGYGDQVTAAWMEATGAEQEPLIQIKATAGGGAAHQGKTVKPFLYLGDADFAVLDEALTAAIDDCLGG